MIESSSIAPFASPLADLETKHEIELEQILSFYKHPVRSLLSQLGVYSTKYFSEDADNEPFYVDPLSKWKLRKDFSEALIAKSNHHDIVEIKRLEGILPGGALGNIFALQQERVTNAFIMQYQALFDTPELSGAYSLQLNINNKPIVVKSNVRYRHSMQANTQTTIIFGSDIKPEHFLIARIEQVFANAVGINAHSLILNETKSFNAPPLSQADATELLTKWVDLYEYGIRTAIPLSPDIAKLINDERDFMDTNDVFIHRIRSTESNWEVRALKFSQQYSGDAFIAYKKGVEI